MNFHHHNLESDANPTKSRRRAVKFVGLLALVSVAGGATAAEVGAFGSKGALPTSVTRQPAVTDVAARMRRTAPVPLGDNSATQRTNQAGSFSTGSTGGISTGLATGGMTDHSVTSAAHDVTPGKVGLGGIHPVGALFNDDFSNAGSAGSSRLAGTSATDGLPTSVDLSAWAPEPGWQGSVKSCTTWAVDYGMLGWYANRYGKSGAPFAPMYTYSQINHGVDGGSYPADALKVAQNQGSDTRADYVQGDTNWQSPVTDAERANAANYKISGFHNVFSRNLGSAEIALLEQELGKNGRPVAVGVELRKGFYTLPANGVYDDVTGADAGAHEMLALGYDDTGLLVQNSWGTKWGVNGRARLSWRVVENALYQADVMDGFATTTRPVVNNNPVVNNDSNAAPTMTNLVHAVAPAYVVGTTIPVTVNWGSAGDVAAYAVWVSTNGGAWVDVSGRLASPTTTSLVFSLEPGAAYRFAVGARNAAGRWSSYLYTATTAKLFDDTSATFSAGWNRYAWAGANGGNEVGTTTAGATASFTFTGTGVAWVAPEAVDRGQANVYIDGTYVATVDLHAASTIERPAVFSRYWTSVGTHTVTISAVGTAGRPTIDVDAFAALG